MLDTPASLYDIPVMLTIEVAEKARVERGLSQEQFSIRLGYSARAYPEAVKRGKFSRWMAREINLRFRVPMDGVK